MTEIYTLKIILPVFDEEAPWSRTIEIPENHSLMQLHMFIQEVIEFDNDHLYDFYVGRHRRNKNIRFSEEPGNPMDGGEYEKIKLKDIYPLTGLKLFYLFDFGDKWYFEIKKSRKKRYVEEGVQYPRVIESFGENPSQYPDWGDEEDD